MASNMDKENSKPQLQTTFLNDENSQSSRMNLLKL